MASSLNLEKQAEADVQFHDLLADAAGNPIFPMLLKTLAGALKRSRRETLSQTGAKRACGGHCKILAAIRSGDPAAAREAMLEHIEMAEEDLRKIELKNTPSR